MKRQEEAVKAAALRKEKERRAEEEAAHEEMRQKDLRERLQQLQSLKAAHENSLFELRREIRSLEKDLKMLQEEDAQEEKIRSGRVTSSYGKSAETEDELQQREIKRLQRLVSQNIKNITLRQKQAKYKELEDALGDFNSKIVEEKKKAGEDAEAGPSNWYERIRREQEAEKHTRELRARERQARWAAELAEIMKRSAEQTAEHTREAEQSRARAYQEYKARAAEARAEQEQEQEQEHAQTAPGPEGNGYVANQCTHRFFWNRVNGSHRCTACKIVQRSYAFQCPQCRIIACARCRRVIHSQTAE